MIKNWLGLMIILGLVGCSFNQQETSTTERVLRIGFSTLSDPAETISLFEKMHPEIRIEPVMAPDKPYDKTDPNPEKTAMDELLKNNLDLLVLEESLYKTYAKENKLRPLEPLMKKAGFDITQYAPNLIAGMKDIGAGRLYGMPQFYSVPYLIYNKKAFRESGTAFPKDGMTWDEIFDLASRVKKTEGANQRYGLFSRTTYGGLVLKEYASGLRLQMFDRKNQKVTVNTPEWEKVFEKYLKQVKDKNVQSSLFNINFQGELDAKDGKRSYHSIFLNHYGMSLTSWTSEFISLVSDAQDPSIALQDRDDWDIVSFPVHASGDENIPYIQFGQILSIPQQASNVEDAWKFIEFMSSKKLDVIEANKFQRLPLTKEGIKIWKQNTEKNIDAFYRYKPMEETPYLSSELLEIMYKEMLKGKDSVKNMLSEFEQELQKKIQETENNTQ